MHGCDKGLVLREVNWRDADMMLTVLTETNGKISAVARGVRRKSSRISAAVQPLAYSEFTFFESAGRYTINEAEPVELFYELRQDIVKLALASYFAELLEVAADGESINPLIPDKVISLDDMTELVKDIDKDIILVGDCAEAVKAKYFTTDSRVRLSSPATRLQKASSVCLAALNHSDEWGNAESLNARYLQITKAEKDLIDGNLKH